jgi:hypothetical protein
VARPIRCQISRTASATVVAPGGDNPPPNRDQDPAGIEEERPNRDIPGRRHGVIHSGKPRGNTSVDFCLHSASCRATRATHARREHLLANGA